MIKVFVIVPQRLKNMTIILTFDLIWFLQENYVWYFFNKLSSFALFFLSNNVSDSKCTHLFGGLISNILHFGIGFSKS